NVSDPKKTTQPPDDAASASKGGKTEGEPNAVTTVTPGQPSDDPKETTMKEDPLSGTVSDKAADKATHAGDETTKAATTPNGGTITDTTAIRVTGGTTKKVFTRPQLVRLDEILLQSELYSGRDPNDLNEKSLEPLIESIRTQGMQVPVEVYVDEN